MKTETVLSEDDLPADVLAAIAEGRKIVAIKLLREQTGLGLANAKVLVDRAASRLGPQKSTARKLQSEGNTFRLLATLVLLVAAIAGYRFLT